MAGETDVSELDPRDATPGPNRALAVAVALAILAVAAVFSGPLFGPAPSTPSPVATPAASPDRWSAIRRPLSLPALPDDGSCPASGEARDPAGPGLAPLPGFGPVFPFGAFHAGRLYYDRENWPWDSLSLAWVAREDEVTDALVRGRRLDGPGEVGFGDNRDPVGEMRLAAGDVEPLVPGWVMYRADTTRVRQPGCYALQIDTPRSSQAVVFEARHTDDAVAELLARPVEQGAIPPDACEQIQPLDVAPFANGALGAGPAYLAWQTAIVEAGPISLSAAPSRNDWHLVQAAPWLVDPRDRGPVVVRSASELEIRFGGTSADQSVLVLPVASGIRGDEGPGWRSFFSELWIREPGCYALQVDLLTASYSFAAFEVVP